MTLISEATFWALLFENVTLPFLCVLPDCFVLDFFEVFNNNKSDSLTFVVRAPIWTRTSFDLFGSERTVPLALKFLHITSMPTVISSDDKDLELLTELSVSICERVSIDEFNLFLITFALFVLVDSLFNSRIISFASSLASSKISLAFCFASDTIFSASCVNFELSLSNDFLKSSTWLEFFLIFSFSSSIANLSS